jgi:hypothetical protein
VYCAELVASTYTAMGLLDGRRPRNAYDPGSIWSGDDLTLLQGATLDPEIPVTVPASLKEDHPSPRHPAPSKGPPRALSRGPSPCGGPSHQASRRTR